MIAESISSIDANWLKNMAIFIACALASAAYAKKLFWDKPPLAIRISEDQQKVLSDLKNSLAGLAPNEKVDKLVAQLGSFATQEQIREIELALPEMVKREELERCLEKLERDHYEQLEKLERDHTAQLKEIRAYVHEEVHKLRDDMQAEALNSHTYREGVHNRFNALVEVTFEMRGALQQIREGLAR